MYMALRLLSYVCQCLEAKCLCSYNVSLHVLLTAMLMLVNYPDFSSLWWYYIIFETRYIEYLANLLQQLALLSL